MILSEKTRWCCRKHRARTSIFAKPILGSGRSSNMKSGRISEVGMHDQISSSCERFTLPLGTSLLTLPRTVRERTRQHCLARHAKVSHPNMDQAAGAKTFEVVDCNFPAVTTAAMTLQKKPVPQLYWTKVNRPKQC